MLVKRPRVINLFAGPGAGKSTTSSGIFYLMKRQGLNVELVTEYAKDKVWENSIDILDNQMYVLGKQFHRQWRLVDKVDIVVTDSPIALSLHYKSGIFKSEPVSNSFDKVVLDLFNLFDNHNFFINRKKSYKTEGRIQNEAQAIECDKSIKKLLTSNGIPFTEIDGDDKCAQAIIDIVMREK